MRYAIIEDEELARENLREIIERVRPEYELAGELGSVEESIDFLKANEVDLLFMDVELGDGTCFDIIEKVDVKMPIIFTTAYNEYTLRAFKVNSIDYLLKPVTDEDVRRALDKLEQIIGMLAHDAGVKDVSGYNNRIERILISRNRSFTFLNIADIAFFCVEDRYVMAYTICGACEITDMKNMEEVMAIVSNHDFFQLSRSVISSISAIDSVDKIDNQRLLVTIHAGGTRKEVIISATRRKDFLSWLGR